MADEVLRMQAVVTDGFTTPLKALQNLLGQTARNPAGKAVTKDWAGVHETFSKLTKEINGGITPALSRLGVTSLSVGGAVAGIGAAVKSFATGTRDLTLFSKSIGLSVDQLRELRAVGEHFGVSWDQAQGSLKTFAGNLDQVHRRWGEAYGALRAMNLGGLAEQLVSAPNMKAAVDAALEGIRSIQNPVRRREVAELLFGSDQWATVASNLTPSLRKAIKDALGEIPKGSAEAAEAFALNWTKMQLSVERFRNEAIGPLLPQVNDLMTALNQPETFAFVKREFDGVVVGVKDLIAEIKGALEWLKSLKDGAASFMGGNKTGGAVRNGLLPEASIPEVFANSEIGARRNRMDELRRQLAITDEQIGRKESQPDPLGGEGYITDSEGRRKRDKLLEEIARLSDEIQALRRDGAAVQKQSFEGGGFGGLIQTAAFGGGGLGLRGFGGGGGGRTGSGVPRISPSAPRQALPGGVRSLFGEGGPGIDGELQGLPGSATEQYANILGRRESGNRYGIRNRLGFTGRWQMGAGALIDTGYVKRGTTNRGLTDDSAWLGKNDVASLQEFLQNKDGAQDRQFREYTDMHYRQLLRAGAIRPGMPANQVAGILAAAHLGGVGSAIRLGQGKGDFADANGTRVSSYFSMMRGVQGATSAQDATPSRAGDALMGRIFGPDGVGTGTPKMKAEGSVNITLMGGLEKLPARTSVDGLFRDVSVNRGRSMQAAD